jgi:hypothetical protein
MKKIYKFFKKCNLIKIFQIKINIISKIKFKYKMKFLTKIVIKMMKIIK